MWEVGDEWVAKTLSHKDTYDMSEAEPKEYSDKVTKKPDWITGK